LSAPYYFSYVRQKSEWQKGDFLSRKKEGRNAEGQQKYDCELTAAKRLVKRLRVEHRQLQLCIPGDDLYAHEPLILEL
jgi:hypothetical protein